MTVMKTDAADGHTLAHLVQEGPDDGGTCSPSYVETRNGISVTKRSVTATLRPLDEGEKADSQVLEPRAHRAGCEVHVGLCPRSAVSIFRAVEGRGCQPVPEGQFGAVFDTQAALLGGANHEQAAE